MMCWTVRVTVPFLALLSAVLRLLLDIWNLCNCTYARLRDASEDADDGWKGGTSILISDETM